MSWWHRLRADLARPERPTGRDELAFHVVASLAIVAVVQVVDPGTAGELLLLLPALAAFALRPVVRWVAAELFALAVVVPVNAAIGRAGNLEGVWFLSVTMVLYVAWHHGSTARATAIAVVAGALPLLVAEVLVPEEQIGWVPWSAAHAFTFVLGRTLHRQRTLIDELQAAREALAAQAVAEERRRIARELHDLAGHTLAAMVLHVTGARYVLRRDVDEAERALRDAEAVGRSSLEQIRATVAALRTDERGTDPAVAGAEDLPALVDGYRRAGLGIDARIEPHDAAALAGPVGVALHRIAREALANVARHAPGNRVELDLAVGDGEVRLLVADHGRPARPPLPDDGPHFGLVGMAERARALGGRLEAGPTADGWRVEAVLPLAGTRDRREVVAR